LAYLEYTPNSILYHYTSNQGFMGIVGSKKIWLTSLDGSNDPREISFPKELVLNILRILRRGEFSDTLGIMISILWAHIESALKSQAFYTASFSTKKDELELWREYADRGSGVCIGFRPRGLTDMHCRIHKVQYISSSDLDNELYYQMIEFIKPLEYLSLNEGKRGSEPAVFEAIGNILSKIHSIKTKNWQNENEVRLSFAAPKSRPSEADDIGVTQLPDGRSVKWTAPNRRQSGGNEVGYYQLPFGKYIDGRYDWSRSIESITIGSNSELSIEKIEGALELNGFCDYNISRSDCLFK
jgi:hypothetical protein